MTISIILAFLGLSLIYLEFFLPGLIMGIGGAILLFASLLHFTLLQPSILSFFTCFFFLLGSLFFTIRLALYRKKKTKKKEALFWNADSSLFETEKNEISDLKHLDQSYVDSHYLQTISREKGTTKEKDNPDSKKETLPKN